MGKIHYLPMYNQGVIGIAKHTLCGRSKRVVSCTSDIADVDCNMCIDIKKRLYD